MAKNIPIQLIIKAFLQGTLHFNTFNKLKFKSSVQNPSKAYSSPAYNVHIKHVMLLTWYISENWKIWDHSYSSFIQRKRSINLFENK